MKRPLIGPPGGRRTVEICQVLFENLRIEAAKLMPGEDQRFYQLLCRNYNMAPELASKLLIYLRKD